MVKNKQLGLIAHDEWLAPYEDAIRGRHEHAVWKINQLTQNGKSSLSDFATGHLYYGLHKQGRGWVFREWAPNASRIFLIGDFNNWKRSPAWELKPVGQGNWELRVPQFFMRHGELYKLFVEWTGGGAERLPAYVTRVVQDPVTKVFSAQVWDPAVPYVWKHPRPEFSEVDAGEGKGAGGSLGLKGRAARGPEAGGPPAQAGTLGGLPAWRYPAGTAQSGDEWLPGRKV